SRHTKGRVSLRVRAPGSRCDSHRIWKPLQIPSTGSPWRAASTSGSITGENRRIAAQRALLVPQRHGLGADQADGAGGVAVVERAGEGDDADPGGHQTSTRTA